MIFFSEIHSSDSENVLATVFSFILYVACEKWWTSRLTISDSECFRIAPPV